MKICRKSAIDSCFAFHASTYTAVSKNNLRMFRGDFQQDLGGAAGFATALFPILKRVRGWPPKGNRSQKVTTSHDSSFHRAWPYFSNCEAMCPVHMDAQFVSMTDTKKRKNPLPTRMLATLLDLSVSTRIATTKTSSMDHLPRCETNL